MLSKTNSKNVPLVVNYRLVIGAGVYRCEFSYNNL